MILADAYRQAQKIKGEGDAKASAVYAGAYGQNPEFFAFYRSLEAYKATFRGRNDIMVLEPTERVLPVLQQVGRGTHAAACPGEIAQHLIARGRPWIRCGRPSHCC